MNPKDRFCRVIIRDGKHYITLPDGQEIPGLFLTRITQDIDQSKYRMGHALIKLHVYFEEDTKSKNDGKT